MSVKYNVKRIICIYGIIILIPLVFIFVTVKNTKKKQDEFMLQPSSIIQYKD